MPAAIEKEDDCGEEQPVDDEDRVVVAADVAEQAPDREQAARRGRDHPHQEWPRRAGRQVAEEHVGHALPERGTEDDRDEEQERDARRGVPVEAEEAGGRDRDPRARDAGHEREALGEADRDRCARPEVGHAAPRRRAVHEPEEDAEDGQEDRDLPGLAQVLGDEILAQGADGRGRDGGDSNEPRDARLRRVDAPPADAADPGGHEAHDVLPEIGDDRDERAHVQRDVEGLIELFVGLEVLPLEEPRNEDQMAGRGDGKGSVAPWTMPRTSACQFGSALARSPTPATVRPTATASAAPATARMPTRRMGGYRRLP